MKLCLAGTYAATKNTRHYLNYTKYILESFYYIQDWQLPYLNTRQLFLLDSGAFTFMNNSKNRNINWEEYIQKYAQFIVKNNVEHFFELDIDVIVGYEKVKEYRQLLETLTGKKCIPVWHKSRGIEEFKNMCKEYKYIAIGGIVTKEIPRSDYKYLKVLIDIAHKNGCKIHGLGFTSVNLLNQYHFDSVDSTSWKSGGRFGTIYMYSNKKMKAYKKPQNMRAKSANGWYDKLELKNLFAWCQLQDYADKHY